MERIKELAVKLVAFRKQLGFTQTKFSEKIQESYPKKCSQTRLSQYESGWYTINPELAFFLQNVFKETPFSEKEIVEANLEKTNYFNKLKADRDAENQ